MSTAHNTRRSLRGRWLPGVALCLAVATAARGDGSVQYFNTTQFEIPVEVAQAQNIKQVIVRVSTDGGKTYTRHSSSKPVSGSVKYNAKGEGWYYFVVQFEDAWGRR